MTKKYWILALACLLSGPWTAWTQEEETSPQKTSRAASQIRSGLALQPIQKGQVQFTTPTEEDIAKCKVERIENGIRIVDGNGLILREFLDINDDGSVDQWRYFRDGIEVYRDIDENGNKKADNYRWYNMSGTRWGVDTDEDGVIDSWKILSAQELTAEIVGALATGDEARFNRVLLTSNELKDLGLGDEKFKLIVEKLRGAKEKYTAIVDTKPLEAEATWAQFTGMYPSTFSVGTEGSTADVDYYENTTCVANSGGKDVEIAVGTLLRVGSVWKAIDAPQLVKPDNVSELAAGNVFIRVNAAASASTSGAAHSPSMEELDKLDAKIAAAGSTQEMATLHAERANLLENIAKTATGDDRALWIRNLADGIMGAVQLNVYPDGLERLQKLYESLAENEVDKPLAAYVKFRLMSAEYSLAMSKPGVPWMQTRTKWLESLNAFITEYPDAPDTAEAMLQLAIENENDGMDDKAVELYSQIVQKFPESPSAVKAKGAATRLDCVGKPISFTAPVFGQDGKQANIGNLKGRIIVLHFWTTWMNNAAQEMAALKALQTKFSSKELIVFGANLDANEEDLKQFLDTNKITWYQLYEKGAMDSRLANSLGIFSVPTVILIGKDGNVISRNAQTADLETMIRDALK